jgi:methyltransferase OMS1
MGITLLRRWLMSHAEGRVLEIAGGECIGLYSRSMTLIDLYTGTGRNLAYYPTACDLYVSDVSKEMVEVAQGKAEKKKISANFVVMDASRLDFADNTFDTVVDTFGLCSFENESKALDEMKRVCKPGGKILLLEHGRSHYQWLNDILDENEERHASQWGCVWNKDISKLVADAGLALESNWRFHFGTSYFIVGTKQQE